MTFRAFATVMFGLIMLGFSLGLVLGVYLHHLTDTHLWVYLAVPIMGLGSGVAAYGTLVSKRNRKTAEESDG